MSNYHQFSEKIILLKRKERLQNEIKWVEHSIEDVKTKLSHNNDFEDNNPDSDTEMLFKPVAVSSMNERHLRRQQTALRIRLCATEELTNLKVLQSEVNVMVEPPALERESPVLEAGTWREVKAECKIDMVQFLITFYVHHPHRKFAALSYRGLLVTPGKAQYERELRRSVLPGLTRPAHAIEVIRNYAAAHRSRRTTMAHLAELYGDTLYMEQEPECGYRLRFAGALSMHWALTNDWSPVAPFHHAMKFDYEYLDEPYVRRLMQAHKKLSDPRIETDERTALLTEMMGVCLEARGPTDASDGVESDRELASNRRRRHSILDDDDAELPAGKRPKDSEVMAPPKSVPKKKKPKGKENNGDRENGKQAEPRGVKRTGVSNAGEVGKKVKVNTARESGLAPEKAVPEDGTEAVAVVTEREITVPAEKAAVAKIVENTKNIPAEKEEMTTLKKAKPVAEGSDKIKKTVAEKSRPVNKVIVETNDLSEKTVTAKEAKSAAKASDKKQYALTKTSENAASAEKKKLAAKVGAQDQNVVSELSEKAVNAEKNKSAAKVGEKNQQAVPKTTTKSVSTEKTKLAAKARAQVQNVASDKPGKNQLASKLSDKNQKVVAKTTSKANSVERNVLPPKVNEKEQNVVNKISENVVSVQKTKSAVKVSEKTKSSAIQIAHKNVANTDKGKMTVAERLNVVEKKQNATGKEITKTDKTVEKTISAVGPSKKANSTPNVESKLKVIDKSKHREKTEKNVLTKKTSGPLVTSIKAKLPQKAETTVAVSKSVASASEKAENAKTSNSAEIFRKSINKALVDSVKNSNNLQMNNKQPIKSKIPSLASRSTRVGSTPLSNAGRAAPQNAKERVVSKIPQKKYPTHVFTKQNPVRISPRRLPLLKPGLSASVNKLAKPSWSSPRMLKKPERRSITSSDVQVKGK